MAPPGRIRGGTSRSSVRGHVLRHSAIDPRRRCAVPRRSPRSTRDQRIARAKGKRRNTSLAIYVLRRTSSPALAPAAHLSHPRPALTATPPATLRGLPAVRQFLPFTLHHGSPAARRGAACRPRIDAPTRDRFAVPSAPVAATTERVVAYTTPDDTAPINRDPVSSSGEWFPTSLVARTTGRVAVDLVRSAFGTLRRHF